MFTSFTQSSYYDDGCTEYAKAISLNPPTGDGEGAQAWFGGPWGSRSAWFEFISPDLTRK